jgi:hypothetical protein
MLAALEHATAGLLHSVDGLVDSVSGTIRQVDPKVLVAALVADAGTLLLGDGEVKRERVSASRSTDGHDGPVPEQLIHAKGILVERDGTLVLGDKQMHVADPYRTHGLSSDPVARACDVSGSGDR